MLIWLLLAVVFSPGTAIAVAISYQQTSQTLIVTFGPTTGWAGKTITYDKQGVNIDGVGRVSARDVLTYDEQGHLVRAHDGMRAWVTGLLGPVSSGAA